MLFNTARYVLFLPATVLFYYLLPFKFRYIWLLAASYYFYMQWNPWYSLLLFTCTLTTWTAGMLLSGLHTQEQAGRLAPETGLKLRRLFLTLCILFNLGILAFFKYVPFGLQCLNRLFALLRLPALACDFHITLPVGISFFILQSLGYLIDIYRNDIQAEKNVLRYALFVSFFPQLVAGPIERSQNLLTQLQAPHRLRFANLKKGGLLILYGLFLKMVIADRAAVLVNTVLGDTASWPGFYIVIALLFFSVQIYCDFHGYSTIARGSALMMGIHLLDNFNAPYFSRSVKEFWQRWHLSLSGWFRDYLYIPLGGNRKGPIRKESNLLTVFAVSGLWHGASLGFIFWGIFNALCQIAADLREEVAKRRLALWNRILPQSLQIKNRPAQIPPFGRILYKTCFTFLLVTCGWLFFRAGGFLKALQILRDMLRINNWTVLLDGSLYAPGIPRNYMRILLLSILALFVVDYHKYQGRDVADLVLGQGWMFQCCIGCILLFTILLYGCYGTLYDTNQFIYFQF